MGTAPLRIAAFGAEQVLETHISWVLLLGPYAYKIKKPVSLGFLDFSTLEKRRHFCEVELRLNRRFAPDLYLEVIPVTGTAESPALGGIEPIIDYALKMRRFDQSQLLSSLLSNGQLGNELIDDLAATIAELHRNAPVLPASSDLGSPQQQMSALFDSLNLIEARWPDFAGCPELALDLPSLRRWLEDHRDAKMAQMAGRRAQGFFRDCHGDLHLGNLADVDGHVTAFDGLEFDETLRMIDVICDLAFVLMDLLAHDRADLALRVLDGYLQRTGDVDGLVSLRWYVIYRALVRAKVAILRTVGEGDAEHRHRRAFEAHQLIRLAMGQTRPPPTFLAICSGLSGSGKTRISQVLLEACSAVRLRSDIERKRLLGMAASQRSGSGPGEGLYTQDLTTQTYDELLRRAATVLQAGWPVIVDATFLRFADRQHFRDLAIRLSVPFYLIEIVADAAVLRRRVMARWTAAKDASEADVAVLERQIQTREPTRAEELAESVVIENSTDGDDLWLQTLCEPAIRRLLGRDAIDGPPN